MDIYENASNCVRDGILNFTEKPFYDIKGGILDQIMDIIESNASEIYPNYQEIDELMRHQHFKDLPFLRTKSKFASSSRKEKGLQIYKSWKAKDPKFTRYLEREG
ncbi:MAG: hypothetical protein GF308_22270 [Candidatus Heimdallarchaeota archaeon]|nr:hypothetical protein [Candidatus Heimdallarchaeota archaeon]